MRRKDREVTNPSEIADIMSRCDVVHLALNTDTVPYILPLNFGMEPDGMTLYIHGAMTGTKYDLIALDSRASFQMECGCGIELNDGNHECSMAYESVIGWGCLEEVLDTQEKLHALRRLMAQYHAEDFPFSAAPMPGTRIFRLNIKERTAKRRRKMV